eukprot:jgi/Ulvmu1/7902/UM004_0134.1
MVEASSSEYLQCPICLKAVSRQDDAFLQPCYHAFCLTCIKQWVEVEAAREAAYLCPVCRGSCIAYLCSCDEESCDCVVLQPTKAGRSGHNGFVLSAAHRIRRAVYLQRSDTAPAKPHSSRLQVLPIRRASTQTQRSMVGSGPRSHPSDQVQLRTLADPAVSVWLIRELQAVLLMNHPGFVQLAVEQVLRRMVSAPGAGKRGQKVSAQAVYAAVAAAAAPFISGHAERFAENLLSFLSFRGTLGDWDKACLHQQVQAQRHAAKSNSQSGLPQDGTLE